ncbi:MAG: potassium-transporting ATPase subunit KdpC [Cyanobacteria bacterium]|nr:potassium-transporting ATPase subunit KdpC [Cyanobacteriota bacterium]
MKEVRQAVLFTVVTMVLFGGAYPLVLWGVGRAVFPSQAGGSLIRRADGSIVGSALVAQAFTQPRYFQPRPSGVDYNAAASGGTNYGPSNADQLTAMSDRRGAFARINRVPDERVPAEMVTASGAGLDPDISPESAEMQIDRVATARGVAADRVRQIMRQHIAPPALGLLGRPRVNVLELNLALDQELR